MAEVFISYAREDREPAKQLAQTLEAKGFDVWWDRDLVPGNAFTDVIEGELDKAEAVIVLWSETSRRSHWVRDEAAVGRDRNRLVPLSVDGALPPLGFRQIHTVDLEATRNDEAIRAAFNYSLSSLCGARHDAPAPTQRQETPRGTIVTGVSAQPNNKPLKTILKEEKRQRTFTRTFWITSFVISLIMALVLGVFGEATVEFQRGGVALNAVVGFFWVGICLTIGRFFILIGRRLSKRKSVRYFDSVTLIVLGLAAAIGLLVGFNTPGSTADSLFLSMITAAVFFPVFALFSIPIGFAKGLKRQTYEDGK